ncbi:glutamate-gated chloride channel alpha-like [Paramacrobiotus metropolitanus]|uniref:glutamate-gated chloride channel alpha-like n=1 Tax=Paramacrobiotus metropolitanus TaxID=2943436 RepID=UPI0024460A89|nr:glutamate-gated chloride channel alpha-like [Paramacrobiotus metropolitanus]
MAHSDNSIIFLLTSVCLLITAARINGGNAKVEYAPTPVLKRLAEGINHLPPSGNDWGHHESEIKAQGGVAPVNVTVNMYLRQIKLDPTKMELNTDMTLRVMWIDRRLSWDTDKHPEYGKYLSLTAKDAHHVIWMPDLFFGNEKSAHLHQITTPNFLVRVYPDGHVYMSSRILMTSFCRLNFYWFPFDNQTCTLDLGSYGLTTEDIHLQWNRDGGLSSGEPVTFNLMGSTGKYVISYFQVDEHDAVTLTGTYRKLTVQLGLRRENHASFVWRYFLPTGTLVCISWLSFLIRPTKIAARLLIGLAALLGLYHLQVSSGLEPSAATSTTAFDIWGVLCGLIVVASLVVTVVVNYLAHRTTVLVTKVTTEEFLHHQIPASTPLLDPDHRRCDKQVCTVTQGSVLDRICLIVLPATFFITSAVFFGICLM